MTSKLVIRSLANATKVTSLLASPTLASSYNLTLPATTPTAPGQSLISDTSGVLSWGSATATISTFTGTTNPVMTAASVTGLVFTAASTSLTVYVAIQATTNIYSLYNLKVYQKGSTSAWGLAYDVICDTDDVDPQVLFTVTSTGQIQYTLPNTIAGFTSINMMWTLGTAVSNTLTSLALSSTLNVAGLSTFTAPIQGTSLNLSSTFSVTGLATLSAMTGLSLLLGNNATSGSVSSTLAPFFNIQNQTYTDTATAASSTAAGNFSASYLGIPTLAATNTAVTTATASTLTIAGPPTAGTNETITNTYALNVASGNAFLNNGYVISGNLPSIVFGGTGTSQNLASGNTIIAANTFSITKTTGPSLASAGSVVVTIPLKGFYALKLQVLVNIASNGNIGCFILGSDGIYYAVMYTYCPTGTLWIQCISCEEIPVGVTLTPYIYASQAGTLNPNNANATIMRYTVTCVSVTK